MALCVVKRWNYLSFVAILNLIFTSYIFSIIKNYFFFLVKQNIKRRLEVFITNLNHISYLCGSFKTNSVVFHNIFWFSSIFPLENFGKFSEEGMSLQKTRRENPLEMSFLTFINTQNWQVIFFRWAIHYLMALGPNPKKFPRIAESRFGYLKVCSLLEQRQYKNDSTELRCMLILKLPPFFPHRIAEWKSAANSKQTVIWSPSIRSYIILALVIVTRSKYWHF